MIKKTEWLKYSFSEAEIKELAKKLAYETRTLEELEDQKKSVVSDFSNKITRVKASLSGLANNINNGYDFRNIDCEVLLNSPEAGQKSIVRLDTGEIVRVEDMTQNEKQEKLFEEN